MALCCRKTAAATTSPILSEQMTFINSAFAFINILQHGLSQQARNPDMRFKINKLRHYLRFEPMQRTGHYVRKGDNSVAGTCGDY